MPFLSAPRFTRLFVLALSLFSLSACATSKGMDTAAADPDAAIHDPFEGYNRAVFAFNDAVDQTLLLPVTRAYRAVLPKGARTGVHNVLNNLKSPITIGNQMLQGDLNGTGNATVRMVVNSILGLGGIFDVAAMGGIEDEPEDFGQTLAVWGVADGPYMVAPLLPPATLRDYTGHMVDMAADPVRLWLKNTDREGLYFTRFGVSIIDQRDQLMDALADLRRNSIDYYATVRSATYQRRAALIDDQGTGGDADIPNYDAQ